MIMYQERYEIGGQCLDLTNFTLSLIKESQANPELRDYLPRPKFETSTYFVENWVKLCNGEYRISIEQKTQMSLVVEII